MIINSVSSIIKFDQTYLHFIEILNIPLEGSSWGLNFLLVAVHRGFFQNVDLLFVFSVVLFF